MTSTPRRGGLVPVVSLLRAGGPGRGPRAAPCRGCRLARGPGSLAMWSGYPVVQEPSGVRIRVRPQPARAFSVACRIAGSASMPRSERATGPCAFSSAVTAARTSVSRMLTGPAGGPGSRRAPPTVSASSEAVVPVLAAACCWSAACGSRSCIRRSADQVSLGSAAAARSQPADGTSEPDHACLREDPECGHDGPVVRAHPDARAQDVLAAEGACLGRGLLPHAARPPPGTWPTSGAAPGTAAVAARTDAARGREPRPPPSPGPVSGVSRRGRRLRSAAGLFVRRLWPPPLSCQRLRRPTCCRQPGCGQGARLHQRHAAIRLRPAGPASLGTRVPRGAASCPLCYPASAAPCCAESSGVRPSPWSGMSVLISLAGCR